MIFQFNNIEKQLYPTTTKHLIAKRKMNNRNNFDLWATRQPSTRAGRRCPLRPGQRCVSRGVAAARRIRSGPRLVLDTEVDNLVVRAGLGVAGSLSATEERVQHLDDMFAIAMKTEDVCAEIPKAVKQRKLRMIIEKENRICHFKNLAMVMKGKGMDSGFIFVHCVPIVLRLTDFALGCDVDRHKIDEMLESTNV